MQQQGDSIEDHLFGIEDHLFGSAGEVAVQRSLGEFRAGRPISVHAPGERLVVLPLDGASAERVAAFRALCAPGLPQLAVTARRARVLGLEASQPVLLTLRPGDDADAIWTLAAGRRSQSRPVAGAAGPAARAAMQLAKFAQRMPALLVTDEAAVQRNRYADHVIAVPAAAVASFRERVIESVTAAGEAQVPLEEGGVARFRVFRDAGGGSPVAIIVGEPDFSLPVPVRLHSACLTGDVFGSRRCDCGAQLRLALARLTEAGGGVIIYLEQEGRGLGLANKMRAYALQDAGLDTVDANTTLGFDDDERDYGVAARMLQLIGCTRVLLLTNNPGKLEALAEAGVEVSGRLPLYTPVNADNQRYLFAKAARAGHWLDGIPLQTHDAEDEQVRTVPGT